jgi:hypothetical protein
MNRIVILPLVDRPVRLSHGQSIVHHQDEPGFAAPTSSEELFRIATPS